VADKKPIVQPFSEAHSPNGNVYIYLRAAEEFERKGQLVRILTTRAASKWSGEEDGIPQGQSIGAVPADHWEWFLVKGDVNAPVTEPPGPGGPGGSGIITPA
jgi:hypothetical protein